MGVTGSDELLFPEKVASTFFNEYDFKKESLASVPGDGIDFNDAPCVSKTVFSASEADALFLKLGRGGKPLTGVLFFNELGVGSRYGLTELVLPLLMNLGGISTESLGRFNPT